MSDFIESEAEESSEEEQTDETRLHKKKGRPAAQIDSDEEEDGMPQSVIVSVKPLHLKASKR